MNRGEKLVSADTIERGEREGGECYVGDITTGAVINGPATKALNVYEVQEIEGSIQLRT